MEPPQEDNSNSVKTSDSEVINATPPPSVISPKKPIQLGIVQSSTGARASSCNVNLMKKSRWDQAPGSGEIEEESKEENIQPSESEDSNIKSSIELSVSNMLDGHKSDEGSRSKPGRVKLVRTNYPKPENPATTPTKIEKVETEIKPINIEVMETETARKPMEFEKSGTETSQDMEEASMKTIDISEVPKKCKALQIISSNYDSPDESSQEADSSDVQQQTPTDSAYASLERLSKVNDEGKEELFKDTSSCSLASTNKGQLNSEDTDPENIFLDSSTSKTEELNQGLLVEAGVSEQIVSVSAETGDSSTKKSEIKGDENEISKGSPDTEQSSEPSEPEKGDSNLLSENILNKRSETQHDNLKLTKKQDIESELSFDKESDNIKPSLVEISTVQAQIKAVELSDSKIEVPVGNHSPGSTSCSEDTSEDVAKDITDSCLPLEQKEFFETNIDVADTSKKDITTAQTTSLSENTEDFVIINASDLEGYSADNEPTPGKGNTSLDKPVPCSTFEAVHTDDLEGESSVNPENDPEHPVNAETVDTPEDVKSQDIQTTEYVEVTEKTTNENREKSKSLNKEVFNEELKEIIQNTEPACEKVKGNEDEAQLYNDGVDAKMEQIFSDNTEKINQETYYPKKNTEDELTSASHEIGDKKVVSDDLVIIDESSELNGVENKLETNDSLLKLLQSGEPAAVTGDQNPTATDQLENISASFENTIDNEIRSEESTTSLLISDTAVNVPSEAVTKLIDCKSEVLLKNTDSDIKSTETCSAVDITDDVSAAMLNISKYQIDQPDIKDIASKSPHIQEDEQSLARDDKNVLLEDSTVTIEEIENTQSLEEGNPNTSETVLEEGSEALIEDDCTDTKTSIEAPETSKDIKIEELDYSDGSPDLKGTGMNDSYKLQEPEIQTPEVHDVVESTETNNVTKVPFESIKTQISDVFPDTCMPTKQTEDLTVTNQESVQGETINKIGVAIGTETSANSGSSSFDNLDSLGSSIIEETLNDKKELSQEGGASVADDNLDSVTSKKTNEGEGSIEVSQQQTIERSIDMIFEMPGSEQSPKSSTLASDTSTKDIGLEVSSETKKIFSEEMQKEMLKLSPEHDTQCDLSDESRLIPTLKEIDNQELLKSEDNSMTASDSRELTSESISQDNENKTSKTSIDLDREKELTSDDSAIATIQAIDSFLEGDNKASSCIESVEANSEISSNEEDSNAFQDSSTTNEKTNAEDVMLGVEGDLDLGNSLTYDAKKLDLSPSEPSISEENYDLPGDSYDKESLAKEQENTNLLSDMLDDVDANSVASDSKPIQLPKEKEDQFSELDTKDQVYSEEENKERHSNTLPKPDIDSTNENIQLIESMTENKTNLEISNINKDPSEVKDLHCENSSSSEKRDNQTENLEAKVETSEVCLEQASYHTKHEQEVKKHSYREHSKEPETEKIKDVFHATSNESKPNLSQRKDVDLDFESLIPSATLSSKEKGELESSSTKSNSFKKGDCPENIVNVLNEPSSEEEKEVQNTIAKSLVYEDRMSCETKSSSVELKQTSAESDSPKTPNTPCIITEKEDEVNSSISTSNTVNEESEKSKRPHSLIEEISPTKQDNIVSGTTEGIKRMKKSDTAVETLIMSSKEISEVELNPSIKETTTPAKLPCSSLNESKNHKDERTIAGTQSPTPTSSIKARTGIITDESMQSKESKPKETLVMDPDKSQLSDTTVEIETQNISHDTSSHQLSDKVDADTSKDFPKESITNKDKEVSFGSADVNKQTTETTASVLDQAGKLSKPAIPKEVPAPVRVSARQKQRQAAAAAAKEKAEAEKSPCTVGKKSNVQEKQSDKRNKKSLSPTKELHIKIGTKPQEADQQSVLTSQKSPKIVQLKANLQLSPRKMAKEVSQDKLEPITLKLSREENPVIVRSSSLSPKKNVSPHSPQGKTLGYTLKIGKDSTTIIPKDSTPSPTRREPSPGTSATKADLSGKVGYLIKDTGLTITPVAPAETQEQKLNKITLKLSKAGGHPEIKQENKSETWKAIRKLGEIDIVPVEGKSSTDTPKRKDKSEDGSPEKKIKLADVTVEPSTSSSVSKLQGLLTQAPLNQSDSSDDAKFAGFGGSPTEKVSPSQQQQQAYDVGMIRHEDSPQPPRKRGRPRKITSPDDIVHSVSVPHSLSAGLTAKDILAASLQRQSLQQHLHQSYQSSQSYQPPPEDLDSSQPMIPLFDLFEETFMEPSPPTIFPEQVQPSTEIIMRSARGRPIGRSRRPRGSGLLRGHERGGPRGRPRGSRGIKRILEEAMSFPDPDQPITLENIDAEIGPRFLEHAASEKTMALLRKSIEGKKEILEKKARRSDGSDEGNGDLEAQVREMKEKIEAAYQAELKSPGKEVKKKTPEKPQEATLKKSPPGLIPIHSKQEERRKSAEGKDAVKRKLSEDKSEEGRHKVLKRKSTDDKTESSKPEEANADESTREDSQMEVDQPTESSEEPKDQEEVKTEPEPPPKPVKPRPKSKAEIKRIKREKDRLRREAKKLAALEALKAPPPNPCEEDTRMSASDPNGEGLDGEGSGIKKNRMEVGDPEGKEFTVEQIAEYQWPLQGGELYMIQEQISTWLGVKSFQRKYPDLKRRRVEMEERTYLCDSGLVAESMCDLGLTAVSSSEVLDIMFQDFPDQYEELRKHMREKQARELINKQKERKKFEQTLSKSDLKEHAIQSLVSWNASLNKNRNETRKCHLDLQTWTIQYPRSKAAKMTRPSGKLGSYPVALIPGQYADYYKRYTAAELRYFPVNTVLYGPLQPNEMHSMGGGGGSDGSQSESEDSSSSDGSSDSSSEGEGEGTEEEEKGRECKTCGSKKTNEAMLQCSQCSHNNTTVTVWA